MVTLINISLLYNPKLTTPVKIDPELKGRIESFLKRGDNRIAFPSVKNFIDKAVLKFLQELEKKPKK